MRIERETAHLEGADKEASIQRIREEIARNLRDFPDDIKNGGVNGRRGIKNGSSPDQHDAAAVFQALLNASNFPKLNHSQSFTYKNSNGVAEVQKNPEPEQNRSPILPLSLQQGDTSIQNLIKRNYQSESIPDYQPVDRIDFKTPATKTISLTTAPEKLAVQINRFAYNQGGSLRTANSFNDVTGSVKLTTEDGNQHTYQPKGIICHLPTTKNASNANSGHYVYYEHRGGSIWREINDGTATDHDITQKPDILKSIKDNCYVVTYQKQNP
jgi:hypothetical protein